MNRQSKVALFTTLSSLVLFFTILFSRGSKEQTFVILSTNDMHAQIDKFPALATAIAQCRDTVDVILVDAGDRWTGNAFVDLVENYAPIYELMNHLDYDLTIYGNHEFDKGNAYLAESNRLAEFPIISANITSNAPHFPQPAPHYIVEVGGKKIAFVGAVGNFAGNNLPAGKAESYEGIIFENPYTAALEYSYLADECDMLVLVSHSGLERDTEFAMSDEAMCFDQIIGAHSHDVYNDVINGRLVTQTGSRLKNIGATKVTIDKEGNITLAHQNIPLSTFDPDPEIAALVKGYYNNPELNAPIGTAAEPFEQVGLQNLFTETIKKRTRADIGLYHAGGVRLESLDKGAINLSTVLNIEPFGSYIATATMSVEQLRTLVMTKFNDKENIGEAHYIDLVMTTPYRVITDESGDAVDVIFEKLDPTKRYKVAMGDYVYKTYKGLNYSSGSISEILITDALREHIVSKKVIEPENTPRQVIEKQN